MFSLLKWNITTCNYIAVNDQEGVVESLDKEYDEQDDQADDESDMSAEPQAMQRNAAKKEALLRAQQRLRTINQQQDPHRIHYRQHSPRLHQAHTLATRFMTSIITHAQLEQWLQYRLN